MDRILKRRLAALTYISPEAVLVSIDKMVVAIVRQPESVAHVSQRDKGRYLQLYQIGSVAFMLKHMCGPHARVTVAIDELDDFDCVVRAQIGNDVVYKPVQLKQLPPHQVNLTVELQTIIDGIKKKYTSSPELVVAIWINRDIKLDPADLNFEGLAIGQLWFFGDSSSEAVHLWGGLVSDLLDGLFHFGWMKHGEPHVRQVRFKNEKRV